MKKFLIILAALMLLAGCSAPAEENSPAQDPTATQPGQPQIGICLPDEADPYWSECARLLETGLEQLGLESVIRYANNDVALQAEQVTQLYTETAVACLVLAPIDPVALEEAQRFYKAGGVPVIALDRPLMDTDAVALCVSFDYAAIGQALGHHIEKEMALDRALREGRSHTIEFFMGSPDDHNALMLHEGLLSVLNPYIENGVLVCPSGRVSFEDSWILRWSSEQAKENLTRYIQQYYPEEAPFPEICCAASDELAAGCIQALEELGCPQSSWPLITGQGSGEAETTMRITSGKQAVTAVKDLNALSARCLEGIHGFLSDTQIIAETTMNNHVLDVPTRICAFQTFTHSQQESEDLPQEETFQTLPSQ